jgi:indoleamine 2,3-dioxygenase
VPFLEIASYLGLPPTATYSALNLWNFEAATPETDLSRIENLRALHTFTGTEDEEWFYLISVAIEAHGAEIIPVMLNAMTGIRTKNSHLVLAALVKFGYCVREMGAILRRMNEKCRPDVFYQQIRPYLAGSKNMAVAGLPKGVFYDEGDGQGEWRQFSGGSNAQSSLIAFCDVILGVEHCDTKDSGSKNKFFQVCVCPLRALPPLTTITGNEKLHATITSNFPPTGGRHGKY